MNGTTFAGGLSGIPDDFVGEDWMSAMQRDAEEASSAVSDETEAVADQDGATSEADPFGLRGIAPSEWVARAASLAAHLDLAARCNAPDSELRARARELAAILSHARVGGFETILEPAVEQTEGVAPLVEPAPLAVYADTAALMIVPLAYPFEMEERRLDRLEFRPPSFSMVERVVAGEATELDMHAEMAGITPAAFRALRWADAEVAIAAARHIAPALLARKV